MTFDGDPLVTIYGDTIDMSIAEGQPTMDEGLVNAVTLSLFGGGSDWWGNAVASEDTEKLTSRLDELERRTLTNGTRLDAEEYAKAALAWLTADGIAQKVTVEATIPDVGLLGLAVIIDQPEASSTVRYQINWRTMGVRVLGAA